VIDAVVAARIDIVWYRLTDDYLPLFAMPFEKRIAFFMLIIWGRVGSRKKNFRE
jgi:hypothetical protein